DVLGLSSVLSQSLSRRSDAPPPLHASPPRRSSDLSLSHRPTAWGRTLVVSRSPSGCTRTSRGPWNPRCQKSATAMPTSRWPTSRSEEHTSELQSRANLVCRLLLEKKNE